MKFYDVALAQGVHDNVLTSAIRLKLRASVRTVFFKRNQLPWFIPSLNTKMYFIVLRKGIFLEIWHRQAAGRAFAQTSTCLR